MDRVVADDERAEVGGGFLDAGLQHLDRVAADGVHLRVELDREHAIADIDQARAGVALDDRRPRFRGTKELETSAARSGSGVPAALQLAAGVRLQDLVHADRPPGFERSQLPAEAPAHGAIDVARRSARCRGRRAPHRRASAPACRAGTGRPCRRRETACGCARRRRRWHARLRADGSRAGCCARYVIDAGSSVRISPFASFL